MHVEEILEEQERDEVLTRLIDGGYLEGPAAGIARKVITEGTRSLSDRQQYVFRRYVEEEYLDAVCDLCGTPLPTSEIIYALEESGGLCTVCARALERDD